MKLEMGSLLNETSSENLCTYGSKDLSEYQDANPSGTWTVLLEGAETIKPQAQQSEHSDKCKM